VKGSTAAAHAARATADRTGGIASVMHAAADAWAAKAGGTSGVLWGAALNAAATVLGDRDVPEDGHSVVGAVRAGYEALVALGKAAPGDKTMLDALAPFVEAFEKRVGAGADWRTAWLRSAEVAQKAAAETADLRPKVGRARPLAERSIGTPDAGAVSLAMCVNTVAELIEEKR